MNIVAILLSDYVGFMLLVALLISSRIRRSHGKLELKVFSIITILTMIACVVDFFSFFSDGRDGFFWKTVNLIGNTYCFVVNPIFISAWCLYEDFKLYKSMTRVKRIYRIAFIPATILVVIALINMFFPVIFYIDDMNVYHRLPFSYVFYVVDLCYLLYSAAVLNKYEKQYGKMKFFPLYLMATPVVLGCALQMVFYGVSLIWVSLAVGLTSIYMSLQNEFSYIDILTNLYNRAYLDYKMEAMLKEKNPKVGAIMIDVDYFKSINDTYGHSTGDEALIDVARVIIFSKPDKAIATRFAGDEFILLVNNTSDDEMKKIVDNIRDELKMFNETENRPYKLSLSLGYTLFDLDKDTTDTFLKRMDDNMYVEKAQKHSTR
ncbi:GGDEF domain-containing protein [Butyrivibrio sp.]|uniref:GGDEF domain-containing protein n=1 Tax=Butyrivibrio sp. TaxID=28121 RepID=UPI0025C03D2A|nr:GGDEF domain-containing protein [Butyrivibrio sp.]MBQ9305975.1 GGDEF domain-containing protein [Butyrivibrio sp.]